MLNQILTICWDKTYSLTPLTPLILSSTTKPCTQVYQVFLFEIWYSSKQVIHKRPINTPRGLFTIHRAVYNSPCSFKNPTNQNIKLYLLKKTPDLVLYIKLQGSGLLTLSPELFSKDHLESTEHITCPSPSSRYDTLTQRPLFEIRKLAELSSPFTDKSTST